MVDIQFWRVNITKICELGERHAQCSVARGSAPPGPEIFLLTRHDTFLSRCIAAKHTLLSNSLRRFYMSVVSIKGLLSLFYFISTKSTACWASIHQRFVEKEASKVLEFFCRVIAMLSVESSTEKLTSLKTQFLMNFQPIHAEKSSIFVEMNWRTHFVYQQLKRMQ